MGKMTTALEAFILSRDAVGLANQAFFDPSMMGLLYFVNRPVYCQKAVLMRSAGRA